MSPTSQASRAQLSWWPCEERVCLCQPTCTGAVASARCHAMCSLHRWLPDTQHNIPGAKDLYLMAMHGISTLQVSRRTGSSLSCQQCMHAACNQVVD